MNNTSFFKTYTTYEILKYQFENGFNTNKSYISGSYNYSPYSERQTIDDFEFNCCECHETYPVTELTFNNGKIVCKCGAKFALEDLKPGIQTWMHRVNEIKMHNLRNDTFNKVSVPTVINNKYFYCSKCRATHELKDMPIENKQRLCSCGELYSFDEVKIMNLEDHMSTFGDVFFDNNKITIGEVLEIIAKNWSSFAKEKQDNLANLFINHSVDEILIEIELLRGRYEN